MAKFRRLATEHRRQFLQRFPAAHRSGRIIGGIQQDRHGVGVDPLRNRIQTDLEIRYIRRNHNHFCPRMGDKHLILRKIGSNGQHFRIRYCQRRQRRYQRRCCPAGQKEIFRCCTRMEPGIQIRGNGLPRCEITHSRGVAMDLQGIHFFQHLPDRIVDFFWSRNGRIAQAVVEHILPSHFR